MWESLKIIFLILFLFGIALLSNKVEDIISKKPSMLEFGKPHAVLFEGELKSAIITADTMSYQEKTETSVFHTVHAELFETDKKSQTFGQITTVDSRIAENRRNQTIFRQDVVIQNPQQEFLYTDVLHYYTAPQKRVFCPNPVQMKRPGLYITADLMDNIDSPFLKKFTLKGHVHLEIQD